MSAVEGVACCEVSFCVSEVSRVGNSVDSFLDIKAYSIGCFCLAVLVKYSCFMKEV